MTAAIIDIHGHQPYRRSMVIQPEGVQITTHERHAQVDTRLRTRRVDIESCVPFLGHILRRGKISALDRMMKT